jgi:Tfp pilus assembly protein PilX
MAFISERKTQTGHWLQVALAMILLLAALVLAALQLPPPDVP